jgi:hypothetical protein
LEERDPGSEAFFQEREEGADYEYYEQNGFGNSAYATQPDASDECRGEPEQRHGDIIVNYLFGKIQTIDSDSCNFWFYSPTDKFIP